VVVAAGAEAADIDAMASVIRTLLFCLPLALACCTATHTPPPVYVSPAMGGSNDGGMGGGGNGGGSM
jgi:hypothetical protein